MNKLKHGMLIIYNFPFCGLYNLLFGPFSSLSPCCIHFDPTWAMPPKNAKVAKEKHREMATHLIDQRFSDSPTNQKTPLASAKNLNAFRSPFLFYGSILFDDFWCCSYLAGVCVFAKSLGDKSNQSCAWELVYHFCTILLGPCAFAQSSSIIPSVCQMRTREKSQIETTTVSPDQALPCSTLTNTQELQLQYYNLESSTSSFCGSDWIRVLAVLSLM